MDNQIKETICEIIRHRCITYKVAVVFVCDQSGGRSRDKVFKAWESEFNYGAFHFQPAEIEYVSGSLFTGMIVEVANPNCDHYLNEFRNNMKIIQTKLN